MLTPELMRRLPKAELHVHLDGSLRPATMVELGRGAGVRLPTTDPAALRRFMLVSDARDLDDYLRRFDITVALMQTPDAIERVAYEMVEDASRDNIRYLEVRYCPALSRARGLTLDQILEAETRGLARGERDFGVVARAISCSLRHFEPDVSEEIARSAVAWKGRGVVGFDLAGGEAGRPAANHRRAFDLAAEGGLGVTVHAGEAAGPESIRQAIFQCHADRLGHGTRLIEEPALQDYVRDRRTLIEINITSNVQTRVIERAERHPVRCYFDAGVAVTLSSDNWLMSDVTLSGEYWLAHQALGFTGSEINTMLLAGFAGSFLPWPERLVLLERARAELADILS